MGISKNDYKFLSQEAIVKLVYSVYIAFPYVMHLHTLVTLFFQSDQIFFHRHSGYIAFPYVMHLYTLVTLFFSESLENICPKKQSIFFFIVTLVYSGFIAFPYIMHCIHLSHFFFQSDQIFFHRHTCIQC